MNKEEPMAQDKLSPDFGSSLGYANRPGASGKSARASLLGPQSPAKSSPSWLLAIGVVAPIVFALLGTLLGTFWNAVGWLLAVASGCGLLAAFTTRDLRARQDDARLSRSRLISVGRVACIAATLVAAVWSAWFFADWFARLPMFVSVGGA